MKVGIDIAEVEKFGLIDRAEYSHWQNVFSPNEWDYIFKDSQAPQHMAGIFAAKEAVIKALGTVGKEYFRQIEIEHDPAGAPKVNIPNSAISISHTKSMAIAIAILNT